MNSNRLLSWDFIVIPFKLKFSHHTASRSETETVVIQIRNKNGLCGFGESCPRIYVTHEDFNSVERFLSTHKEKIEAIDGLPELEKYIQNENSNINLNPAAWCAVECALLDLFAKEKGLSVESLLRLESVTDSLSYTAVIGIDTWFSFFLKTIKYRIYGFKDFKIKLSGNAVQDKNALSILSIFGIRKSKIRVDGNNLWSNEDQAIEYLLPLVKYIWAIEEPLKVGDFESMLKIAKVLNLKIILDESFLNINSMENIKNHQHIFVPNLRISKMGGVLRTLKIVTELEKQSFQWILGSHVGEMSLLTRASILVSNSQNKSLLIGKEGAFSTHLLCRDSFFPNLKFSIGAQIAFNKLAKNFFHLPGWNMTYNNKDLK